MRVAQKIVWFWVWRAAGGTETCAYLGGRNDSLADASDVGMRMSEQS